MKKILNSVGIFLKCNYKKLLSFGLLIAITITFALCNNTKNVNADSNNGGAPSITYSKDFFNSDYFENRDSESNYLSMFTNSSHVFYINNTNGSSNTANLSYGNYFTIADNDNLTLTAVADSSTIINGKSSGVSNPYYVVYNNSSASVGCIQYTVSYDNFVMPIPRLIYDNVTGDPLYNYSHNTDFGIFINAFRDYFKNDRVFFSRQNVNGNLPCNVSVNVYLPNSNFTPPEPDSENGQYDANVLFTTNTYSFSTSAFNDGKIGDLYDDLFLNAYNDDYATYKDIYVPHIITSNTTNDENIINEYYGYAFIPKLSMTFSLVNTQFEYDFARTVCYHRTPYTYDNTALNSSKNSFLDVIYNAFIRSCFGAEGQLNTEYYNYGYSNGYYDGNIDGYYDGYDFGFEQGLDLDIDSPLDIIFRAVESFLDFEIFPSNLEGIDGFKVSHLFLFGLGVTILGIILKLALGG